MAAIRVRGLSKHYGALTAVDGIDLTIEEGEVFALLGPNGAGKSTTVEILEGHRIRTAGDVDVLGFDPATGGRAFRERIGIVLQQTALERELEVAEVIATYAGFYPRRRDVDEVIHLVGLDEKRAARIKTLSGGQKRRLELALGIVGDPDVIFLDEPTTGFDPSARRQAWELIANLRTLGRTILLTTHYMDEAQNLADRVAVIANGQIVAEGTPESIGGRAEGAATITFVTEGLSREQLPAQAQSGFDEASGIVTIQTPNPTAVLNDLTGWALERGVELEALAVARPSLEDIYLQLTEEGM
ncbi:MAG: ABC transporter ATP-binding protein [Acidimicrobiia bacterium]|nr:ABC transporter ATP-binding protein [Acidimicrobiia bacterium]MBT8192105.1 ABC transporter ATP-binding protein [Acidimicrobiia bacterium]NNF87494.1 ABC transporter ATP-binding protein [Acidimicrobiia bacterium]NNJ48530.1 ABC transporter ATP-binding protein [Acidimicrobiia bacterium]NNL14486.1 ABC transporter ATP-binding protein [Acidimicrobiia bacterium]